MGVEARASSAEGRLHLRALKRDTGAALQVLGLDHFELSLLLCDDAEIQRLNRDYRHKDKPTDVLSFPQDEGGEGRAGGEAPTASEPPRLLGDVVISLPTAQRQAQALGQSPRERLRRLMIHGVLHLIGYDHERSPWEARRMFARERDVARALDSRVEAMPNGAGTGAVLADGPRPRSRKSHSVGVRRSHSP